MRRKLEKSVSWQPGVRSMNSSSAGTKSVSVTRSAGISRRISAGAACACYDGAGAAVEAEQAEHAARDVELRHARQADIVRVAWIPLGARRDGGEQVGVGELHAFRVPGRATGVELNRHIVRRVHQI